MQRRQALSQGFRGSDVGSDDSVELMGRRLPLKWASLVLLIAQNTCLVLAMRYSRTQAGPMYLASTAVVCAEVVKMVISVVCLAREMGPKWSTYVIEELFSRDTLLLALPGLLYTVQNNLLFIALSNLQAAVYQVTYQLKILTTALMTSLLLGRRLNRNQIISLGMLTLGVALVQLAGTTSKQNQPAERRQYPALGLFCVLAACLTSGFAGVYTEKVIKHGRSVPLFMRNIQLSSFGIILGLCGVVLSDFHAVYEHGFFQGYNKLVWFVILLQAGGGLMIAVVMKYADNILKGFATSISIVLSSYLSMLFFNFRFTFGFAVGSSVVIAAVFLYSKPMASIVDSKPSNV